MKRRVCQKQGVMFETRLSIHISRCEKHTSQHYMELIDEKICSLCPQKEPIGDKDELADSMADDVFNVEVNKKSEQIFADLISNYCADCLPK